MLSYLNVFIGFLLNNFGILLSRKKSSTETPVKFSFKFWIKDNIQKWALSLIVSFLFQAFINFNATHIESIFGFKWNPLYSLLIGAFPDMILELLKKSSGFLQPKNVKDSTGNVYRKDDA